MIPQHILVLDPIAFRGGSKIATETLLGELDLSLHRITVLSADPDSWQQHHFQVKPLRESQKLSHKEQGYGYLLRHILLALQVLFWRIRLGRIDLAIGGSGPGVDLALYLIKPLLRFRLLQLIHGPVACSKLIGRCLTHAERIFYLPSAKSSLTRSISRFLGAPMPLTEHKFRPFTNGLNAEQWPSPCHNASPRLFWAASLLKWKGLDRFLAARELLPANLRPDTDVCFIAPKHSRQPSSAPPSSVGNLYCHQEPPQLDAIRAQCSIFVSTSIQEPFGLSILEALAAGLCVIIPADGAYWDQHLTDHIHCRKYQPDSADDLAATLRDVLQQPEQIGAIGQRGAQLAQSYQAKHSYREILTFIQGERTSAPNSAQQDPQPTDGGVA